MTERLSNKNPCNDCRVDRQIGNPNRWECECDRCSKPYEWKNDCIKKLAEYETAEEDGRLVVLPVGIGDEVYIIEKCENIPERLDGTMYELDGSLGTATGYYCPYEENCPFDDEDFTSCDDYKEELSVFKDCVEAIHINEDEVIILTEKTYRPYIFGKTLFLSYEEAEKVLEEIK